MKLALKSHSAHWLLGVGVALGVASANPASGFTLTHEQESEVTTGMTAGEVRQVIGSPLSIQMYGNEPGPTWTYSVLGQGVSPYNVEFDIHFGTDGRVASVNEVQSSEAGD
jgi:outer membrane protein assembly factor BamE (lipoprotein component of BamABCDE complex)